MIARIWRGWAPQVTADDYQRHFESEVSEHLRAVDGFRGAQLLRRDEGQEVMFTSITWFTGVGAVRGFAGDDFEQAARAAVGERARVGHPVRADSAMPEQGGSHAGRGAGRHPR
jgi:heme-degrading monooxygenase HmoA